MGQLENMIMQKTDYSLPDSLGILMTFKYDNVNLMDFDRFDELHDIGYNRTIQLMDSIKARISRRINYRQLELKRIAYKKNMPELRFREISITGGNEQQKKYIRKEFHSSDHEIFSLEDLRKGYFRLMSDNMISEIIPHAVYNKVDTTFTLHLKVKIEDDLSLRVGGNVGSNGANQIYVGATYHNLNNFSKEVSLDGQLGQIYNNLQIAGRIDFPTHIPTSFRLVGSISSFDYFKQEKLFSKVILLFSIKRKRILSSCWFQCLSLHARKQNSASESEKYKTCISRTMSLTSTMTKMISATTLFSEGLWQWTEIH
mgnify:CR=1 FL=1